jgi:hypothetical protein
MSERTPDTMFASRSVPVHVIRGVVGLAAAVGGFGLLGVVGPVSLLLLVVAGFAWRGCPTCWAVGLTRTRARAACVTCPPARRGADRAEPGAEVKSRP